MMKATACVKLENDVKFKKEYLRRTPWWKNFLIVAPSLLLFLGLGGLLFLAKNDMLITVYTIPFIIIFLSGTIWLKGVKKHLQGKALADTAGFKVCLAQPIATENAYTYFVFDAGQKRHNEFYIKQLTKQFLEKPLPVCKNKAVKLEDPMADDAVADCYMIAYQTENVRKQNAMWESEKVLPLLYVDAGNVFVIKGKNIL